MPAVRSLGFSLLEVLIGVAVAGVLLLGLAKMYSNSASMQSHLENKDELTTLRRMVQDSLSCSETLRGMGNPAVCGNIPLKAKSRDLMMIDASFAAGSDFYGSGRIAGQWYARASCGANSLVVEVARRHPVTGGFSSDPLNKDKKYDFNSNRLFGDGAGDFKLCTSHFGGVSALQLNCQAHVYYYPAGGPANSTRKHKCPTAGQIMTSCQAIMFPGGERVCGATPGLLDGVDSRAYCRDNGCTAGINPTDFWGVTYNCCDVMQ